jgi:uncharacterized membrane protein
MESKAVMTGIGLRGDQVNVGPTERLVSVFGGSALAVAGVMRRDWAGAALAFTGGVLAWRGLSGHCPGYAAAGINRVDTQTSPRHTEQVVTIDETPEKLYQYWRKFENLPQFMKYLESVREVDSRRSVWRALGPANQIVEWEAEITEDIPNRRIAWRSDEQAVVPNSGSVEFQAAPGARGTEVRVRVEYRTPAGAAGDMVAKLLGRSPAQEVREDLRRFKQQMEAGEVATIEGQPSAHDRSMFGAFSESAT